MRATRTILLLLAASLLPLVLASCDDDDDDVGGPGAGAQPLVSSVTASHEVVDQGGTVTVSVDAAGEGLAYLWTATGGSFATPAASTTTWTAPDAPGVYLLTVTVRGADNLTSSASVAVGVEVALQLTAAADTVTVAHTTTIAALAVGAGLTYHWTADAGTLRQVTPDTVTWKAPDTAPVAGASVRVLVSTADGDARSESIALTVLPYAPADAPAYRGAAYCGGCHADLYESWLGTAHVHAVQTLADIGMDGNGYCLA